MSDSVSESSEEGSGSGPTLERRGLGLERVLYARTPGQKSWYLIPEMYVTGNGNSEVFGTWGWVIPFFSVIKYYRSVLKQKRLQMYWKPSRIYLFRDQARTAQSTSQYQATAESSIHTMSTQPHLSLDAKGISLVQTPTEIGGRSGLLVFVNIEKHHQQYSRVVADACAVLLFACPPIRTEYNTK